ncbi:MAG: GNAT family N-acetyltransferase [Pyrinomonadaceae bacterium]
MDYCLESDLRLILYRLVKFGVERARATFRPDAPGRGKAQARTISGARRLNTKDFVVLVNIRIATLEDVPALRELIRESVKVLSSQYYTSTQIASGLSHVFGVDTQLILDNTYLVAQVENIIVGCGGWSKRKTLFGGDQLKKQGTEALLDPTTEPARIRAFYVHPRWSRRGIGSRILQACEIAAGDAGFEQVELVATLPGVPFYLARAYEKVHEVPIDTPDGESLPALRMKKILQRAVIHPE